MSQPVALDSHFTRAPHEVLRELRREGPVTRAIMFGDVPVWLVTRYAEAKALLSDPRLSKDHARAAALFPPANTRRAIDGTGLNANMLQSDPPDHTRLRRLVVKAFTTRAVERLRSRVMEIAEELLDDMEANVSSGRPVDLIRDYAVPLPMRVIGELLGVPDEHAANFRIAAALLFDQSQADRHLAAAHALGGLLMSLIASKRQHPTDDLLSALIEATDDGDHLSEEELVATTFLLILAGYDTTANLIGNGSLALLRNPSQLAALRDDPALIPNAVEELLRFDSPVNVATTRYTTAAIEVDGVTIPENELVMISLLSANRDSNQFADADRLNIGRKAHSHLAFGSGIHHCVGAALARMEGRIALAQLLARFDQIEVDPTTPLQYRDSTLMHGLMALPVHCRNTSTLGDATGNPLDERVDSQMR
jgi:cytochrome P450